MSTTPAPDTQAILLLTAPLQSGAHGGPGEQGADPLSLGEYNDLARALHEQQRTPADLLGNDGAAVLDGYRGRVERSRLERLLARGFALAQAYETWQARGIWVASRAEAAYPKRLRARLKESAPPILYGCGNVAICATGGLAIVGSRNATPAHLRYAAEAAALAAGSGLTVVSGGARGIDQAAMDAALAACGNVVGMLAEGLLRAAVDRRNREALRAGRLVLLSVCDPSAGFHTGFAMQRNRLIYALADAGLVVDAEHGKGGTWAGATEQLDKLRLVPVYLRNRGDLGKGMAALRARGALPWPHPQTADEFAAVLAASPGPRRKQSQLPFVESQLASEVRECTAPTDAQPPDGAPAVAAAGRLLGLVRELVAATGPARSEADLATHLGVTRAQARVWLAQFVAEGVMVKTKRPVKYRPATSRDAKA